MLSYVKPPVSSRTYLRGKFRKTMKQFLRASVIALCCTSLHGADTSLQLSFEEPNGANEFARKAMLTWYNDRIDSKYRVQSSTNAADPTAWRTVDVVVASSNGPVRW